MRKSKIVFFFVLSADIVLVWVLVSLLCLSCSSAKFARNNVSDKRVTKTIKDSSNLVQLKWQEITLRDTVHVKDSVFVERRNDTLVIDRWHTIYKERAQTNVKADTVFREYWYMSSRDSTSTQQTNIKPLISNSTKKICLTTFIIIVIILLIIFLRKRHIS